MNIYIYKKYKIKYIIYKIYNIWEKTCPWQYWQRTYINMMKVFSVGCVDGTWHASLISCRCTVNLYSNDRVEQFVLLWLLLQPVPFWDFHRLPYILKTLVCLYLYLMFIGYSSKLRWMFHKLYGSGDYTVCQYMYIMLHVHLENNNCVYITMFYFTLGWLQWQCTKR